MVGGILDPLSRILTLQPALGGVILLPVSRVRAFASKIVKFTPKSTRTISYVIPTWFLMVIRSKSQEASY